MRTHKSLIALLAVLLLVLTACGGGDGEAAGEEGEETGGEATGEATAAGTETAAGDAVASQVDLSGVDITVGSKEFTEQLILGEMAAIALEEAGATVDNQIGLQGSNVVREALLSGEIDAYWEYTGTGWITYLGNTEPVEGEEAQFEAVAEADLENDVVWFARADANNSYALAVPQDALPEVQALSDIPPVTEEGNPGLCAASEFLNRDDGLPGLQEAYGFEFEEIVEVELGLIFTQIGDSCQFGEVFATDGRIVEQDLRVLEDDQNFFPKYNIAMTMNQEVYTANEEAYQQLFGAISEELTNEQMRELNRQVDVEGEDPEEVARQFLVDIGVISG